MKVIETETLPLLEWNSVETSISTLKRQVSFKIFYY